MSQRKEKYLRRALNEANRLEGAAVELAAMGQRLERHLIGTDRRLAQNIRDTQQVRDELVRQRRRNRRVHRSEASTTRLALAAFTLAALALPVAMIRPLTVQEEATTPPVDSRATDMAAVAILRMEGLLEPEEDPEEAEKIDTALVAQGYLSDEIPLSYEEQDFLRTASSEGGVPYALALAVIETETGFRNVAGDEGGASAICR